MATAANYSALFCTFESSLSSFFFKKMDARKLDHISLKEYQSIEIQNQTRYEFHNGSIHAMAGGTIAHGLLCGNIFAELRSTLKDNNSNCTALSSEIKLHIEAVNSFVYPDAMVICAELKASETDKNAVTNPILIVEVLSKSTANYDRGDKFYKYRQIPTLREYVLIEQEKAVVEVYSRQATSDLWRIMRVEGLAKKVVLTSIGVDIELGALYEGVNLELF